jgi:transcription termination/antitermination protein NusG
MDGTKQLFFKVQVGKEEDALQLIRDLVVKNNWQGVVKNVFLNRVSGATKSSAKKDVIQSPGLVFMEVVSESYDADSSIRDGIKNMLENRQPVTEEEDGRKWYSLRVIAGQEKKIKTRIDSEVKNEGWSDIITNVVVPTEKVYKIKGGKKVIMERNIMPGYLLVEAVADRFSGEIVQAISNLKDVIYFIQPKSPIALKKHEADRMLGRLDESETTTAALLEPFLPGQTVKIIDGPFNDFIGDIKEVNEEKKKLKVIVKIFGRGTEVELNFMQVEKQH